MVYLIEVQWYTAKNPQIKISYSHLCLQIPSVTVACGFLYSIKLENCICIYIHIYTCESVYIVCV